MRTVEETTEEIMARVAAEDTNDKIYKQKNGWERVHHSDTSRWNATEVEISVYRLPVPGGWIYKVTELDHWHYHDFPCEDDNKEGFHENHKSVSICFVPKP